MTENADMIKPDSVARRATPANARPHFTSVKWILTFTILGGMILVIGPDQLFQAARAVSPFFLLLMLLVVSLGRVTESLQMSLLLAKVGAPVPQARVLLANLLSSFYSLFVPGDLVAGAAKWVNLSAATGKRSLVLNAIVYNRLALLLPPLIFGAVALAVDNPFDRPLLAVAIGMLAWLAIVFSGLLYLPLTGPIADRTMRALSSPFPKGVTSRVEMLISSLALFRALRLQDHLQLLSVAILSVLLAMTSTVVAFRAVGIELDLLTIIWAHALVVAVRQLPITVSGLGVREGLLVVILQPFGVPAAQAVTVGLVKFLNTLYPALAGGLYQAALVMGWANAGRIVPAGRDDGVAASSQFQPCREEDAPATDQKPGAG